MKFLQLIRSKAFADNKFGFLFLASFVAPMIIILQSPEQMETPKLIFWAICVAVSLIITSKDLKVTLRVNKFILYTLMALFVCTVVSTIFSFDVINSLIGTNIRMTSSVYFVLIWSLWILLLTSHSKEKLTLLFRGVVWAGGFIALVGLLQSFGVGYYAGMTEQTRVLVPSLFGNPNFTSMFLVPVAILSGYFIFSSQTGWQRAYYIGVTSLSLYNILYNTSRGATLGLLVATLILIAIFSYLGKWRWLVYSILATALFFITNYLFLEAIRPADTAVFASLSDPTTQQRFLVWDRAADFIITNPLTGSGPGNFFIAYRLNSNSSLVDFPWFDDAHNLILHFTASIGVPAGVALLVLISAAIFICIMSIIRQKEDMVWSGVLLSALIGWLIAASFNPVSVPNWIIFGLILGGIYVLPGAKLVIQLSRINRTLLLAVAILIICGSSLYQLSDLFVHQSGNALGSNDLPRAQRLVNLALNLNPTNITAILMQGSIYLSSRDAHGLESSADTLIALHPRSTGMARASAAMYYQAYKLDKSELLYNKLLRTLEAYLSSSPYGAQTYQEVAYFYMLVGDNDKALQYSRQYAVLANNNYYSWILLAKVASLKDDKEEVIYALNRAFLIKPSRDLRLRIEYAKDASMSAGAVPVPFTFGDIGW